MRRDQDESGCAAPTGPRKTHTTKKGEKRKVKNLGDMP